MAAKVSPLVLRSERSPDGVDARTIRVGKRIRVVRQRTRVLSERIAELTRQFLDDDFVYRSGAQQGQPLARQDRLTWLSRLAALHRSYCAACDEEVRLQALLRRIEGSLDGTSPKQSGSPCCDSASLQPPA